MCIVEIKKYHNNNCVEKSERKTQTQIDFTIPATDDNSSSISWKCSIANLVASGDGGLWVGGVGKDIEEAVAEMRASSEGELGPSWIR